MGHARNITPDGINSKQVRQWAADNGWKVGDRGRFSHALLDAYVAAQSPVVTVEHVGGVAVTDMSVPF